MVNTKPERLLTWQEVPAYHIVQHLVNLREGDINSVESLQRSVDCVIMDDEGVRLAQIHFRLMLVNWNHSRFTAGIGTVFYVENCHETKILIHVSFQYCWSYKGVTFHPIKAWKGLFQNKVFLHELIKWGNLPAPTDFTCTFLKGSHLLICKTFTLIEKSNTVST